MHYPIDLDALPASWEKGYVGDFSLEIQPGFASGKHNKEGLGIPHIRPFNIDRLGKLELSEIKSVAPDADRKRLHSGDVLFNNTNSPELIGKTSVIATAGDWGFSNHMTRVAFSDAVSPKFAAYQLHYLWMRGYFLHNCVKHVNQASVSSTTLARAVPFVKPPRPQQDSIVAEIEKQFSRLDEAVASLKRIKANLKRYKATVLKAAVEGKLTEDWRKEHPDVEPASKLLERILAERRAKWKGKGKYKEPTEPDTDKLPPLPEKWCWLCIDTIAFVTKLAGFEYTKYVKYDQDGDLAVLKAENAGRNGFKRTEFSRVKSSTVSHLTRSRLQPGDILMVFVGAGTGNVARVPEDQEYFLGPNIAMIRVMSKVVSPAYLELFLRSPLGNTLALAFAKAVAQPSLSMGTIRKIPVSLSCFIEQKFIVTEVERRLSVIEELEAAVQANLTRADRLRQSILTHAFEGKLINPKCKKASDLSRDFPVAAESRSTYRVTR
jgi:type I restriction enzyme S subunit